MNNRYVFGRLIATFCTMAVILVLSVMLSVTITNDIEKRCLEKASIMTTDTADMIHDQVDFSQSILQSLSKAIADSGDLTSENTRRMLESFGTDGVNSVGLLTPDNNITFSNGMIIDVSDTMSFEAEAKKGVHITGVGKALFGNIGKPMLYLYSPVVMEGETAAMVLNAVNGSIYSDIWRTDAYYGKTEVCVADCSSGDIIAGKWIYPEQNIFKLESMPFKRGYSYSAFLDDVNQRSSGHIVIENAGDFDHISYAPVNIENWMVFIYTPEKLIMQEPTNIKNKLLVFFIFEIIAFLAFFIFVFLNNKRESEKIEKQLSDINFTHSVEKLLFEAHRNRQNIRRALKKISTSLTAQGAFVVFYDDVDGENSYYWAEDGAEERLQTLIEVLKHKNKASDYQYVDSTPIYNLDNIITGLLGVVSAKSKEDVNDTLANASVSFSMLYSNLHANMLIKALGEKDTLTGLLNRNSYENNVDKYPSRCKKSLTCIYVDVNGLHDLNNSKGHAAGDAMLRYVANELLEQFGTNDTYRIGGDEFVAFAADEEIKITKAKLSVIMMHLSKEGFHASIGTCNRKMPVESMDELINTAEKKMYDSKAQYYKQNNIDRRAARGTNATSIEDFSKLDIVNDFPGGFFICSAEKDMKIIFSNDETMRMYLCDTREEFDNFVGGSFRGFVHPDDFQRAAGSILKQSKANFQGLGHTDFRIIRKDGSVAEVESFCHYVNSQKYGKLFYIFIRNKDE